MFIHELHATVIFMDEDDVATYTIKTIDDPRTLNKTLYLRPPDNILSQRQLVEKWEEMLGKRLEKITISGEDFLASMKSMEFEIASLNNLIFLKLIKSL